MKLFSNPHARRSIVSMMLFAWLFVLASGVANACVLQARETHSHVTDLASELSAVPAAMAPGHAEMLAGHGDGSQNLKAPCLKACDDGSRALFRQSETAAQPDPGPAPLLAVLWSAVAPAAATLDPMGEAQPPTPGLPVRIRYSRLAL